MSIRRRLGVVCGLLVGAWSTTAVAQPSPIPIGDPCNVGDECEDDGTFCTIEFCNGDVCVRQADDLSCGPGVGPCFGVLTCEPENPLANADGCVASGNPCNDFVECTDDACTDNMDGTFSCANTPNDANCPDDGLFCTPAEVCSELLGCVPGDPVCAEGLICDEDEDACRGCRSNDECDNGIFCDGEEVCVPCDLAGCDDTCEPGTPPTCDDGVNCTVDACDTGLDECTHTPNDAACDDGLFCTGVEACTCLSGTCCAPFGCYTDALNSVQCALGGGVITECFQTGCLTTVQPPDCDDHVECTADSCNEDADSCDHVPNDAACDDGFFCNGAETCVSKSCPDVVYCCIPGAGCFPNFPRNQCAQYSGLPLCECTGGVSCCKPGQGCAALADASACAAGGGYPVCDDCSTVLCCPDLSVAGANGGACSTELTAFECAVGGAIPICGDCYPVQCCGLPCDTGCGTGRTPENEPACGLPTDTTNGGCNSTPNVFSSISCGEEICGTAGTAPVGGVDARDTDWYEFVLAAPASVTFAVTADFAASLAIFTTTCPPETFVGSASAACETGTITACLPAGTYRLVVSPAGFTGVPCGEKYVARMVCGPCFLGATADATPMRSGSGPSFSAVQDGSSVPVSGSNGTVAGVIGSRFCPTVPLPACILAGGTPDCGGCEDGPDPCPGPGGPFCSPGCGDGACVECFTDSDCDDGDACNGREQCVDDDFAAAGAIACGTCVPGTPPNCGDGFDCTVDTCVDDGNNQFHCEFTPNNAFCDNGLACDGVETCDALCVTAACQAAVAAGPGGGPIISGCVSGPVPDCDDGITCTLDVCDECTEAKCTSGECTSAQCAQGYQCDHLPKDPACDDQIDCTLDKCLPGTEGADPVSGCVYTRQNEECDNGMFCDGEEICIGVCNVAGTGCSGCAPGTPVNCNDGIQCTSESCDEDMDKCVNMPRDSFCDNDRACDGKETCAGGRCPNPVLCCEIGEGCVKEDDISECENGSGAGDVRVPLCYADGCLSAICCDPGASDCTEDPVAPHACLGAGGIPICNACESVVCCSTNGGVDCDTGVSPEACVDSGRIPACGDCLVRCCFQGTAVAGNNNHPGCIEDMPLDLCTFLHGRADCSGCEPGTPPRCGDEFDCTVDGCLECTEAACTKGFCTPGQCKAGFKCTHEPDDAFCDDGVFCNGEEHCNPGQAVAGGTTSGCVDGPPPICPKGTECDACVDGCAGCLGDHECIDSDPCTVDGCVDVGGGVYKCVNKTDPSCTPPPLTTTQIAQKGSLLIFSKIELKWDNDGNLLQDTFLSVFNDDDDEPVDVQVYFINGDVPLEEVCMGSPCVQLIQEEEPGWNTADCRFTLTKTNPVYWSAARGGVGNCQPFTALDDSVPPGRPDPENDMKTRILRGYVIMWAIALNECATGEPNGQYQEIRWNDLTGDALIVNYERGYAWDYKPWAFQAHGVDHGEFTGTPGVLNLDGVEYDAVYARLLLDFLASGSQAYLQVNRDGRPGLPVTVDTDLTLHPASSNVRQDREGPIVTKADFSIYNEFEAKFSGTRRCIQCWDQRLLSHYTAAGIPNHFKLTALGTDGGVARIEGVASTECNFLAPFFVRSQAAPLLGVSAKVLTFGASPSTREEWAGTNLIGVTPARAAIHYDLFRGSGSLLRFEPTPKSERTSGANAGSDASKDAAGTR